MLGAGDGTIAGQSSSRRVIGALSRARSHAIPTSHGHGRGRVDGGAETLVGSAPRPLAAPSEAVFRWGGVEDS
jgi:hypothetical protein